MDKGLKYKTLSCKTYRKKKTRRKSSDLKKNKAFLDLTPKVRKKMIN